MILATWCELFSSRRKFPMNEICCDECDTIWVESSKIEKRFDKWGGHFCSDCLKKLNGKRIAETGKKALSKLTKEERIINAGIGGKACQKSPNRDVKSFTTDRWAKMSPDERKNQVMVANNGLQDKLKNPEYREEHFRKVFKNSKIGYISKGQREVFDLLVENGLNGFELDGILSNMKVDVINHDKKIAIEYNGDYYHCNPRTWSPEQYNKSIKMTAAEKWEKDRSRRFTLMNLGYVVLVIWESGWKIDKNKYVNRIKRLYNEIN